MASPAPSPTRPATAQPPPRGRWARRGWVAVGQVIVGLGVGLILGWLSSSHQPAAREWTMEAVASYLAQAHPQVPQWTANEAMAKVAQGALLLDVRTCAEYEVSHLPGARWCPSAVIAERVLEGRPRELEIVVYCSVGVRSTALADELRSQGYTAVGNLAGGLFGWVNDGRGGLVAADGQPTPWVHPYDAVWGQLLRAESRWPGPVATAEVESPQPPLAEPVP